MTKQKNLEETLNKITDSGKRNEKILLEIALQLRRIADSLEKKKC